MASISNYYLERFVLENATSDRRWDVFMRNLSKVYCGQIPDHLLTELMKLGNDTLTSVCETYVAINDQRKQRYQIREQEREEKKRQDEMYRAMREKDADEVALKWKQVMIDFIEKRESELHLSG